METLSFRNHSTKFSTGKIFDFAEAQISKKNIIREKSFLFFKDIGYESGDPHDSFTQAFFEASGISIEYKQGKLILGQILRGLFKENPAICVEFLNLLTEGSPTFRLIIQNGIYGIEIISGGPGSPISNYIHQVKESANDSLYIKVA